MDLAQVAVEVELFGETFCTRTISEAVSNAIG